MDSSVFYSCKVFGLVIPCSCTGEMSTTYEDMLALAAGGARRKKKPAAHRQPPGLKAYAKFRKANAGLSKAELSRRWHMAKGRGLVGGCGELYPQMPMMMPQHPIGSGSYIGGDGGYMGGDGGALVGGKGRKKALRSRHASEVAMGRAPDLAAEAANERREQAYKLAKYNWTCPPFYNTDFFNTDEKNPESVNALVKALAELKTGYAPRRETPEKKLAKRLTDAFLGVLEKK